MPGLVVLGSLNMDLLIRAPKIPTPGETVLASDFAMLPGGKGANQAYAAAKLGARVAMVGKVGYDLFGDRLRANLAAVGVDVSQIRSTQAAPTGVAAITVDADGQNSITVASGANFYWQPGEAESLRPLFRSARFALFQLETPLPMVAAALAVAKSEGLFTILDPAPAQVLPPELFTLIDLLTPNESEAFLLLGESPRSLAPADAPSLARRLHALGAAQLILKLGAHGSYYSEGEVSHFAPAWPVEAVDTTAAGDTYNAALAVALADGRDVPAAMAFANKAAALSATRAGAQSSAPSRSEVDALG